MNITCTPIHSLNDDCLLHIFKSIETRDRFDLELVCQRWQRVCAFLWKTTRKFNIITKRLRYDYRHEKVRQIDVYICREVFSRCFSYLTEINLSSGTVNFEGANIINSGHACPMNEYLPKRKRQPENMLVDIKDPLSYCENIEKLSLCCCMLKVNDEYLIRLFERNRKLRSIVLSCYEVTGNCLSYLPLDTLESIELYMCDVSNEHETQFSSYTASKLHTLSVVNCLSKCDLAHKVLPISSSKLIRLNLKRNEVTQKLASDICTLKNLEYLSLSSCDLNDGELSSIIENCKKLIALDISSNYCLTDVNLKQTASLPHLKCLNIAFAREFTDAGLATLSEDLQVLNLTAATFSPNAILEVLAKMQSLELLNLDYLEHLNMDFVRSAIEIVELRSNTVPLEIGISGTLINIENIMNTCPLIRFNKSHTINNFCEYFQQKF